MSDSVLVKVNPRGIATLTLNRPEIHNAFDDEMVGSLIFHLETLSKREELRALILHSKGKHFSAGADLNWMRRMKDQPYEENIKDAEQLAKLMFILDHFPQPTVVGIQGAAFGGALGLIACCDIAVASSTAYFALSEVQLGLVPAVISPYVIRAIGARAARKWFLTGEKFSSNEAMQMGLVHEVTEWPSPAIRAQDCVEILLKNAPNAVKAAKALIFQVENQPLTEKLVTYTAQLIAQIRVSDEGQEGLAAFLEKRPPRW